MKQSNLTSPIGVKMVELNHPAENNAEEYQLNDVQTVRIVIYYS